MTWHARLVTRFGLGDLGGQTATANAARALADEHRALDDLEKSLARFAHPAGTALVPPTKVGGPL